MEKFAVVNGRKVKLYPFAWAKHEHDLSLVRSMFVHMDAHKPCLADFTHLGEGAMEQYRWSLHRWNFANGFSVQERQELIALAEPSYMTDVIWVPYPKLALMKKWVGIADAFRCGAL